MNTKKLKAWDSSKLDLDADYDSKTMQDWLAILQGKKVPDAEPNNRAYAEAVRYGLKALQKGRVKMSIDNRGLKATTLDVYDYLMENDSDIGTNIKEEFYRSICVEEDGVIYLLREEESEDKDYVHNNYKITITKLGE